jgi:hypothetical protein
MTGNDKQDGPSGTAEGRRGTLKADALLCGHDREGWEQPIIGPAGRGRLSLLATVLVGCVALFALFAADALAATTHNREPFSPLSGSGSSLTLEEVSGVAIDEATGNVFVTDGGPGHERVAILGGEGGAPVGLAAPYEIPGLTFGNNAFAGLAYANDTLYVSDQSMSAIRKYTRNGTTEKYEPAGEIPIPNGATAVGLSVDAPGDLYASVPKRTVDEPGRIYKFAPSGALLEEYVFPTEPVAAPRQLAVDSAGDFFVAESGNGLYEFPANAAGEIDPSVYRQIASGANGVAKGVAIDLSIGRVYLAQPNRVVEYEASSGAEVDSFGSEEIGNAAQLAFNSATDRIYVGDASAFASGHHDVNVFGPGVTVPTTTATPASNVTGTKATLNGAINPEGIAVTECFFEYGETASYGNTVPCEAVPPTDSDSHPVDANVGSLKANGVTYHYRLVAKNENGTERSADRTFTTAQTVVTQPATGVGTTAATLNGYVRPEGVEFQTCDFEYKLTTQAGFQEVACNPEAAEIDPDFAEHPVEAQLTGLQPNSTYEVRLKAVNTAATHFGSILTFSTSGPPQISEIRARDATQGSVVLEAKVNPSGFGTSWHFDWGPTAAYGQSAPGNLEQFIGDGTKPVLVRAELTGLSAATVYHYRLVATSGEERTTASPDQVAETLDTCGPVGLPDKRCFEMVSPHDLGPVAAPGRLSAQVQLQYQAAPSGPGSLAYVVEGGLPDATRSGEVLYLGQRNVGAGTWESNQYGPGVSTADEKGRGANPNRVLGLASDLRCGVVASSQPLTTDPSGRIVIEAGGGNLYRLLPDGSYQLITYLSPENLDAAEGVNEFPEYRLVAISGDCSRIIFESTFSYPGIPGKGEGFRLYEWHDGTLKNIAMVPEGSSEVPGEIVQEGKPDRLNALSRDGSRAFFTARLSGTSTGVFARVDGTSTVEIARCTGVIGYSNTCARFLGATPDGSRVYFTAKAGLTTETSSGGKDLYEYNFAKPPAERLADLSVSNEAGGAEVGGLLGFAEDGSHVYFAALAQLVPGRGNTRAENVSKGTYSVYDRSSGSTRFVGTVSRQDVAEGGNFAFASVGGEGQKAWSSRVSPEGRYLLFESTAGHPAGSPSEAYLYDADATAEPTVCISCRQDGKPPRSGGFYPVLENASTIVDAPMSLTLGGDGPRVFFYSEERLATGGAEGEGNIYEWTHGQVFHIAAAPEHQVAAPGRSRENIRFVGASEDGADLYFFDAAKLNWENQEGRYAAWDARVGGGFPEPVSPPAGCDPLADPGAGGSCQGPGVAVPSTPGAGSETLNGPGNVKPGKHHRKHHHKRRHHQRHHKQRKHKQKKHKQKSQKSARPATGNRRAGR